MLLAGCSTPYQRDAQRGGFSEAQLDANVFRVTFQGNARTGEDTVTDYALLRSAELALRYGYPYFVLRESKEKGRDAWIGVFVPGPYHTNVIEGFKEKPEGLGLVYNTQIIRDSLAAKYGLTLPLRRRKSISDYFGEPVYE